MKPKSIFLAFPGHEIAQETAVCAIADGYETWNLKKFHLDGFVAAVQRRIAPVNAKALRNYKSEPGATPDIFALSEPQYGAASWGLLLPDHLADTVVDGYSEILFLLSLYSPYFLFPCFYVTDFGIVRLEHNKDEHTYLHNQNQVGRFKSQEFIRYYQELSSEAGYGSWNAYRMAGWKKEDWRMFVACLLFSQLKAYENIKYPIIWQRESADMATLLEALFTAGTDDNSEVGYKLRKRAAALVGTQHPGVETEIKKLYKERSSFVHGSFFEKAAKHMKVSDRLVELPMPPFDDLYRQKECVRKILLAYLYIHKILRSKGDFKEFTTVIDILEEAIINLVVRSKVRRHVDAILSLCP